MTNRSENNLTEIMERLARGYHEKQLAWLAERDRAGDLPEWDDLDPYRKQQIKQELLPAMMAVLDVADEVDAEAKMGEPAAATEQAHAEADAKVRAAFTELCDTTKSDAVRVSRALVALNNPDMLAALDADRAAPEAEPTRCDHTYPPANSDGTCPSCGKGRANADEQVIRERIARAIEANYQSINNPPLHSPAWFVKRVSENAARIAREGGEPA